MLRRQAYASLLSWRQRSGKILLVDGARQIGKTFLIEEFAKREYPSYIKVDFLRDESASLALSSATSARQVLERLSLMTGQRIEPGQTLVFLDEVQEAPGIVTFSKYLAQDGRFDVVMSGSLLGIELSHARSLPVGYMDTLTMHPLTFLEFCDAQGVPAGILDDLREATARKQAVEPSVHRRMTDLFRLYLVVGGMPEAVVAYGESDFDLGAVRELQTQLVSLYGEDIAKHAGSRAVQVKSIFDALPSQLAKENKRFMLKSVGSSAKYERLQNDFAWLVESGAALKATNVSDPRAMLERSVEPGRFKLYASDTGMLMARYRSSVALEAISGARGVNFGSVYENVVAQELAAGGIPLHYYQNNRKGEVDFLVETAEGRVLPIEVKSGKDYRRHVALNNLMSTDEYGINEAIVLTEANVSTDRIGEKPVRNLPLYLLPFIVDELREKGLGGVRAPVPTW